MNKIGKWEVKEAFDYVETTGTKTNIKDIEDITAKSSVIYKWTNNMLIENCHNYGFDYGVYPGTNSANPEYLIVRAPAIKGFVLRGTGSTDGNANKNFTFYNFGRRRKLERIQRLHKNNRYFRKRKLAEQTLYSNTDAG